MPRKKNMFNRSYKEANMSSIVMVNAITVMKTHEFTRGFKDAKAGIKLTGFEYANNTSAQWQYERGRQFAALWPKNSYRENYQITYYAKKAFNDAIRFSEII